MDFKKINYSKYISRINKEKIPCYEPSVGSNEILGIYSLPTVYIFNEKGKKIKTIVGTIVWDSEQIIKKLKTL